ncbi:hypothetical protein P691DRAFT_808217 [Macrolepiota fuliginosa MF-IS2]|uniref:Uncharacterized protein n=1 Tax=Macrolepiota fuliginosa MF-IS2 TaxID=1400762 RepID=A0A9P5X6S4_9AGAR|nr:hypothetical protein P691DRAFT_808217 [Macrolepiota fuliginosa MF-IS2]
MYLNGDTAGVAEADNMFLQTCSLGWIYGLILSFEKSIGLARRQNLLDTNRTLPNDCRSGEIPDLMIF